MLEGGCFCGFIRYRAGGRVQDETLCHCSICRRVSAAPLVAWFTAPAPEFSFVSGEPAVFRSSDHGERTFCPRCGTPLTFRSNRLPAEIDVTICSLDAPERVPPRDHTRTSSALRWVSLGELPAYPESRP